MRKAVPFDARVLGAILSDWIDATDWMPRLHTRNEDRAFVSHLIRRGGVTVAEVDQRVGGFLSRTGEEIDAFYVGNTSQGLGRALLEEAQSGSNRLTLWTFAANAGARRFYARHGFVEVGGSDGDNEEGLPDIRLAWEAVSNG